MIYTVTLNPAIDYIIYLDNFQKGELNRVEKDYKCPGGKGINVSRVLNNLQVKSIALGFVGGFTGRYIKEFLEVEGVKTDFILVEEDTRINIKIKANNEETEINGRGPTVEPVKLDELLHKIKLLNSQDCLVLAGNVQASLPQDVYAQIQAKCGEDNVKVIVDTTGKTLLKTLKHKPFLIKPNLQELCEVFNTQIKGEAEILKYGRELLVRGAQNVIISMAAQGAFLLTSEGDYHAVSPQGQVKNSVGAGDSLVAGFLASYSQKFDLLEAFKWGIAAGSATAFSVDLCTQEEVKSLLEQVRITKIS